MYEVLYDRQPGVAGSNVQALGKYDDLAEAKRKAREAVAYGVPGKSLARVFDEDGMLVYEVRRGEENGWIETPLPPSNLDTLDLVFQQMTDLVAQKRTEVLALSNVVDVKAVRSPAPAILLR